MQPNDHMQQMISRPYSKDAEAAQTELIVLLVLDLVFFPPQLKNKTKLSKLESQ